MKFILWIKDQINWIKSFLSEQSNGNGSPGKGSSKRLAAVGVTFTFMYIYIKTAITTGGIPEIPEGWRWILFIVLGVTGVGDMAKNWLAKK